METVAVDPSHFWTRPDGTDVAAYVDVENWSNRRWAWEFLRRNADFVAECAQCSPEDKARRAEIARNYYLVRFRDPRLKYSPYIGRLPEFAGASVKRWRWSKSEDARQVKVVLREGQMLVKFDLSAALYSDSALATQLQAAAKGVETALANWIQQRGIDSPKGRIPRRENFLRLLRLLDLLDVDGRGKSSRLRASALKLVNDPRGHRKLTDAEWLEQFRHQIATARRHSEVDYRYIAAMPDEARLKGSRWPKRPIER